MIAHTPMLEGNVEECQQSMKNVYIKTNTTSSMHVEHGQK